jgi:hypothetical protein
MGGWTARHMVAAGLLVSLGSLAACSSNGNSSSDSAAAGVSADGGSTDGGSTDSGGRAGPRTAGVANRTLLRDRAVVMTGRVALSSTDLEKVRADVDDLMAALGGSVESEQTSNDRHGRTERSTLVLRVPVDRFTPAKKALARMGRLKTSDVSAKDVTTEVIDVDERVQTLQASLDDLQRFQRKATDVKDLLDFEDKIAARQAELQSLEAQQAYLADQTSMSTITLYLSLPDKYVPPPDALKDAGFLAGLRTGWNALLDVAVVGLTVLGALLPFGLTGLLLGVPAWVAVRTLLRRRRAPRPPAAATE